MQRVIEFKVFGVFALARPPNPEKHPKSIPRDPQSTQNLSQKEPRGSQRRPESAQGAPPKRPNRTLRPPGSLWESFQAPQDLILELLRLTCPYCWDPKATQELPKRPNRTLTRPGSLWESFRAPQDLILELLKVTFPYFWDPPATQQPIPVLCSLLTLLSPLLSPSWVLGPDSRPANFDPGT